MFVAVISLFAGEVKAEPYGWSPQVDFSNQGPPACTDAKPDKAPILLQPNHPVLPKKPKKGEVVLYWHKVPGATSYNVYYGLSPRNYIYSAVNIGDIGNFTVGYLPNKNFYFAVQALNGCAAGTLSHEWSARPGGGGYAGNPVLGTTAAKIVPVRTQAALPEAGGDEVVSLGSPQQESTIAVAYEAPTQNVQRTAAVQTPKQTVKKTNIFQNILAMFFRK